jgi:ribosomal protein S18 acetylase RimI-like enzyme
MTKVIIRDATEADYSEITAISVQVWQQAYKGIIDQAVLDQISFESRLQGRINRAGKEGSHSIVAVDGTKIVGFCDFGASRHLKYGKGEIYAIYVLQEHQKSGVGTMLLEQAMSRLEEKQLVPYFVFALEQNITAQKFYERLGFQLTDKVPISISKRKYLENVYLKPAGLARVV